MAASVSIIIPTHDRAELVGDAVRSVLDQHVPGLEVIVVDDGSSDDTGRVLRTGFGGAIRVVCQDNAGPAAARNTGIDVASGALVGFLDSDDLSLPGSILERMQHLDGASSAAMVVGRSQVLIAPGPPSTGSEWRAEGAPVTSRLLGATLVRREALDRIGPFDERMRFGEDEDWFWRADELGLTVLIVDVVCQQVRRHDSNMTLDHAGRQRALLQLVKNRRDRERAGLGHDVRRSASPGPDLRA